MSRDDVVLVKRIGHRWYILYGCESINYTDQNFLDSRRSEQTRAAALMAAHDLSHERGEADYGVMELLDPLPAGIYHLARGVIPYNKENEKPEIIIRRMRDDW